MQHEENKSPQTQIVGEIYTEGGAVNTGQIQTNGGDVTGRDKHVGGDDVHGDKHVHYHQRLDPADQRNQRNHAVLRQAVRRFWIDGVLKGSLHNEVRIRLKLSPQPDAVNNRPWDLVVQQSGEPDRPLAHDGEIKDVFAQMDRQLLILGEPGAGKTTTLLMLAEALLAQTEQEPDLPTPVVFNLSSWAEAQPPLDEWLVDELRNRYQMPSKVAQGWVENDELVLLLDGLDEVAVDKRTACVEAINAFRDEHIVDVVVCSRTEEYAALTAQLRLAGAVTVRPLTPAQIEEYLTKAGAQVAELRTALAESDELQELAQTPLMLSVMTLVYQEQNGHGNAPATTGRTTRQRLFDRYIQRMFQHRELPHLYDPLPTLRWLHWLAGQMTARSQTLFFIERLQPNWLESKRHSNWYQMITKIGHVLFLGLCFIVSFGLTLQFNTSEILNFGENGLLDGLYTSQSIYDLGAVWKEILLFGLIFALLFGLYGRNCIRGIRDFWKETLAAGLIAMLIFGLFYGPSVGLAAGLVIVFTVGFIRRGESLEMVLRGQPNQGTWQSLKVGLFVGISFALLGELFLGLILGYAFGFQHCLLHVTLRWQLYWEGRIPRNYARFLDYAAARLFLRKVGGGYVFVHRMVLEHFAELSEEDMARIVAGVAKGSGK